MTQVGLRRRFFFLIGTLCVLVASVGCQEDILHDLDEAQANQVRVVLTEKGITSTKKREGKLWNIGVASIDTSRALTLLEESRILRRELRKAAENSSSLMQSPEERYQMLERNLAWNLEQTLERIPLVLEARVHLSLSRETLSEFVQAETRESASVLLVSHSPNEINAQEIQKLVSGASGISQEHVMVVVSGAKEATTSEVALVTEVKTTQPTSALEIKPSTWAQKIVTRVRPVGIVIPICVCFLGWSLFIAFSRQRTQKVTSKEAERQRARELLRYHTHD